MSTPTCQVSRSRVVLISSPVVARYSSSLIVYGESLLTTWSLLTGDRLASPYCRSSCPFTSARYGKTRQSPVSSFLVASRRAYRSCIMLAVRVLPRSRWRPELVLPTPEGRPWLPGREGRAAPTTPAVGAVAAALAAGRTRPRSPAGGRTRPPAAPPAPRWSPAWLAGIAAGRSAAGPAVPRRP